MARTVLVLALLVVFAVGKVLYERRAAHVADRSGLRHPRLPAHLRGAGRTWVVFATEYCAACGPVVDRLRAMHPGDTVHKVMVEHHPSLADDYAVRTAPTLLEADGSGAVIRSLAGAAPVLRYVDALASA